MTSDWTPLDEPFRCVPMQRTPLPREASFFGTLLKFGAWALAFVMLINAYPLWCWIRLIGGW